MLVPHFINGSRFGRKMSAHIINVGTKILHGGEIAEVVAWLSPDKLQILTTSKAHLIITPDQIEYVINHDLLKKSLNDDRTDLSSFSTKQLSDAQQKHDVLSKYIQEDNCRVVPIEAIAAELALSISHTYKIIERFRHGGLTSLILEKRGRKQGAKLLPEQVESIIQEAIKSSIGPSSSIANITSAAQAMCAKANLPIPSRKAISYRVKEKPDKVNSKRIYGSKKTRQDYQVRGNIYTSNRPLELVQIDHCIVDVIIVDSEQRQPRGRPWLTLAIDVHTRSILGFYLTMDHPSSLSLALCMVHAVSPKNEWLHNLGLHDMKYPMYGLPQRIHVDNGKDFRSNAFIAGCKEYNINLTWRPPATPHHGAHIERLIGTLMKKMRGLPGATLASVADKKRYTNIEEPGMTFSELRDWLIEQIGIYHAQEHSSIGCAPLYKWEESLKNKNGIITPPPMIINTQKFFIDFLPYKRLKLQRGGIRINSISYYSHALKCYSIKTACVVRYNPASIKKVWVKPEGSDQYIECPYADIRLPDISLSEFKAAKRTLAKNSAVRVSEIDVFSAIQRSHYLVSTASKLTKKSKKNKANSESSSIQPPVSQRGVNELCKVDYSRPAKIYDVE